MMTEEALAPANIEEAPTETPIVEEIATEKDNSTWLDFNVIEDPVEQQKFKDRTNKDFKTIRQQERAIEDSIRKNRELEKQLLEARKPPEVTEPTEAEWDLDYVDARARQIKFNEAQNAKQRWQAEQDQLTQREQLESQQRQQKAVDGFVGRAKSAGIDQATVMAMANIASQRLPEGMQIALSEHEYGPQLLKEIISNELVLSEMASLRPYEAGMKLAEMSKAYRPRTKSNAPAPDEPLSGSGASRGELKYAKGATFT